MKKIYTTLAGAVCLSFAGGGLSHETPPPPVEISAESKTGQETVAQIRSQFESGSQAEFLLSLESDYQTFAQSDSYKEFIQMRSSLEEDAKIKDLAREWEALHKGLITQRNDQLKAACAGQEGPLSKRVESVLTPLSDEQKEALRMLSSLRFKLPEQASSADEKTLIEIDLAAEYKSLHLDAQHAASPISDRLEKQILIKMDMLKKMQEAAATFQDSELKKQVLLATEAYDHWQAQSLDWKEIQTATRKPVGDVEKRVASILAQYKSQKDDLYQKEFLAKLQS